MDPITFNYTGAIQTYTVTVAGTYTLTAAGAQGGRGGGPGGQGAQVSANFGLQQGSRLFAIVGQAGANGSLAGGGGGGGSFVYLDDGNGAFDAADILLLAAGGGGGRSPFAGGTAGFAATANNSDSGNGSGGTAGSIYGGGGGAGVLGSGGSAEFGGQGAPGITQRGAGNQGGAGGYGGGGGGGEDGGGGGGGYTGGGGGSSSTASGGGRSYVDTARGTFLASQAGAQEGDGQVGIVCFATGTLIRTARGDVAVDDLIVGDLAVTASGAHKPIRWIGHRTIDPRRHPKPDLALPVRIGAHALGPNRPARDLVVSPGHAICLDVLDEVLIPAYALLNGTTITQDDVETVTYWHVELDSHDILIAEGQPAESFLDLGNRPFFAESGVVDLDAAPDAAAAARGFADYCRPYVADGVVLDAVRAQVQARAERLGWRLDVAPWADMHLMVDGVRVEADTHGLTARFVLPASAQNIWLLSETGTPSRISNNRDPRKLGLCIQAITIDDGFGDRRSVALDDARLSLGFHDCEDGARRWTAGRSRLPAELFAGCRGTVFLRLDLVRPALPRWVPPAAVADLAKHEAPCLSLVA